MTARAAETQSVRFSVLFRQVWPKDTAKEAARAAQCSVRSAQKWLADICDPTADSLIKLARSNDQLRAEIYKMMEPSQHEEPTVDRRMAARGADSACHSSAVRPAGRVGAGQG